MLNLHVSVVSKINKNPMTWLLVVEVTEKKSEVAAARGSN